MPFLRTVTGDMDASEAGICYAHEHIIIDPSFTTYCNPDFLLDSVELACADVLEFREAGGRTLVDSMPCGGGRNVRKLAQISARTGVHIVCPTGLHLKKYYPPGHWGEHLTAEQIADLFIADIEAGIDARDYNGPLVSRTTHRAGVIKVATGGERPTPHERKIIEAAVIAHQQTGAPILTHTEQGAGALEQLRLFQDAGVSLGHLVLSHIDRRPDPAYHKEILSTGVMLEYDSTFRWAERDGNPTLALVLTMFAEGFGEQILLGMDAARRKYWRAYGGSPGLRFLLRDFLPRLQDAGLTQSDVNAIFVRNPQRCYSFFSVEASIPARGERLCPTADRGRADGLCVFCHNREPVLASNQHAIAIIDKKPISPGHTLIISRSHVATIFDLPALEYAACFELVRYMKDVISRMQHAESFNIVVNCGIDAGQTVNHAHIHLVPRYWNLALAERVSWSEQGLG